MDETGFDRYYDREYGYAPRGEKIYGEIAGRKFQRESLVAAKPGDAVAAPMQYQGTMNAALFEAWFENSLMPEVPPDAAITMDNASFHRKNCLNALSQKYGIKIIFLPRIP